MQSPLIKSQFDQLHFLPCVHQTEALTDDLDLQDFAFNSTRSAEIGYYRDIGDM
mgnify:FL=1